MASQEVLRALEIITGETDPEVLTVYTDIAAEKIINRAYPFRKDVTEVPQKYQGLLIDIAVYMLQKRGAEGQTSHSENGINRLYGSADIPSALLRPIVPECGMPE